MDDLILNPEDTMTKKEKAWLKAMRKDKFWHRYAAMAGETKVLENAKTLAAAHFLTPNQMIVWKLVRSAVAGIVVCSSLWKIWF